MGTPDPRRQVALDQRVGFDHGVNAYFVGDEDRDDAGTKICSGDGHFPPLRGDDAGGHGIHQRYDRDIASVDWSKRIAGAGVVRPVVLVSAVVEVRRAVPHERPGAVPCDPRLR